MELLLESRHLNLTYLNYFDLYLYVKVLEASFTLSSEPFMAKYLQKFFLNCPCGKLKIKEERRKKEHSIPKLVCENGGSHTDTKLYGKNIC